ncbi:MAG: hypothetical protein D6812_13835 [Deltaproteobacteria bacterium]|nr:MAG: hypothetical protein D6812_13835 [Deltaproteobacteria bacterium]
MLELRFHRPWRRTFMNRKVFLLMILLTLATSLTSVQPAVANGIYLPETGARALGRGAAFAADPDDLSAFWFNPAGLANLDGWNAMVDVGFVVASDFTFDRATTDGIDFARATAASSPYYVPALGLSYSPPSGRMKRWTVALGVYTPSAPKIKFPEDGAQRYTVIEAELFGLWTVLGVGWNVTDSLRLGINVGNAMGGFFKLKAAAPPPVPGADGVNVENPETDVISEIEVYDRANFTAGIGVSWDVVEHLTIGASLYNGFDENMTGSLTALFPDVFAAQLGQSQASDDVTIRASLPWVVRTGISYALTDYLEMEFDVVYSDWSAFKSFDIDLETGKLLGDNPLGFYDDQSIPVDAGQAWTFGAGFEYSRAAWQLRGGFYYDESAIPDDTFNPFLYDGNKTALTLGFSRSWGGVKFDFSYAHLFYEDRIVENGVVKKLGNDFDPEVSPSVNNGKYTYAMDLMNVGVSFQW